MAEGCRSCRNMSEHEIVDDVQDIAPWGWKRNTSRTSSSLHHASCRDRPTSTPSSHLTIATKYYELCRSGILYELDWSVYYSDAATGFRSSIRHSPPTLFPILWTFRQACVETSHHHVPRSGGSYLKRLIGLHKLRAHTMLAPTPRLQRWRPAGRKSRIT